ncbi:twin-arginine translocation signal domain-containing protein [Streptosporangium lutulentum]
MDDGQRLARVLGDPSRRTFLGFTGAAMALAFTTNLADPWTARSRGRDGYPFQLGVASGDPCPTA